MATGRVEISEQNFMAYLERLTAAMGHADRHEPLRVYLEGLLLPGERKSVEPMAARIDPRHLESRHQSMHHFVDTFYGRATDLRDAIAKRGLQYVAAIREDTNVFLAGPAGARDAVSVKNLAKGLPKTAWRSVWWRHGTKGEMRSRFALLRVRVAH